MRAYIIMVNNPIKQPLILLLADMVITSNNKDKITLINSDKFK